MYWFRLFYCHNKFAIPTCSSLFDIQQSNHILFYTNLIIMAIICLAICHYFFFSFFILRCKCQGWSSMRIRWGLQQSRMYNVFVLTYPRTISHIEQNHLVLNEIRYSPLFHGKLSYFIWDIFWYFNFRPFFCFTHLYFSLEKSTPYATYHPC